MLSLPDFTHRSRQSELLDDPSIQGRELEQTLEGLERVNRLLGGYGPSIDGVAALLGVHGGVHGGVRSTRRARVAGERGGTVRRVRLLDVGTGSADTPRVLSRWARARGIALEILAIDLTETTVAFARHRSRPYPNITVVRQNLFELDEATESFDIVHAALMLHHLEDAEASAAVAKMHALSRLGVVINDLHRHPVGYAGSRALLPLLSRNRLIRNDGPISVLRAFTRRELEDVVHRAGLPAPQIRWYPMFRWQVLVRKRQEP